MKKRFIAGAVCPQCQSQDTLRWWQEHEIEKVECVRCDFHEQRLPKSVEKSTSLSDTTKQQVIGIFKPQE